MIDKDTSGKLQVQKDIDGLIFPKVPKGTQAIIEIEGHPLIITIANPKEGDPKIIYNTNGFVEINGLVKEGE